MHKSALPLVACLLALVAAGAGAQTVYKWRDANGEMHISDSPPPTGTTNVTQSGMPGVGRMPTAMAPASGASAAGDAALEKKKDKLEAQHRAASAAEQARAEQQRADARAVNCSAAQEQIRELQSGQRVAIVNAKGERVYLDDQAIASRLRQAQQTAAQSCGPDKPQQ